MPRQQIRLLRHRKFLSSLPGLFPPLRALFYRRFRRRPVHSSRDPHQHRPSLPGHESMTRLWMILIHRGKISLFPFLKSASMISQMNHQASPRLSPRLINHRRRRLRRRNTEEEETCMVRKHFTKKFVPRTTSSSSVVTTTGYLPQARSTYPHITFITIQISSQQKVKNK